MLLITVTYRRLAYLAQRELRRPTPGIDLPAWGSFASEAECLSRNSGENDESLALLKSTVPAEDLFWARRRRPPRIPGMGAQNRCSGPRPAICGQSIDQRIIGRVGIARRGDAMAGHRWGWSCRADTPAEPRRLVAAGRRLGAAANESDATGVPIARIGS